VMEKDCNSQRCRDMLSNPYKLRHPFFSLSVSVPVSICGVCVCVCVCVCACVLLSICLPVYVCVCMCVCVHVRVRLKLFQGANKNRIIGAVGFGKQRPGKPEDSSIPDVQMVIATCWKEDPSERLKPMDLLVILSGNEAVLVQEEGKEVEEDEDIHI